MDRYDAAIIGGGLTGLSAAYHLAKAGKRIIVLEKSDELGGLASSWRANGYWIEKFYHHLSVNDHQFVAMVNELGLADELLWERASTGYYYEGKLYKMDTPLDILRFQGLGVTDIIRIALILLKARTMKDYSHLDAISTKEWLIKIGGRNSYRNFFEPLLRSKFGKNLEEVSAAWMLGRIKFRSGRSFGGEKLGYLKFGFKDFVDRLGEEIVNKRGKILTTAEVNRIAYEDSATPKVYFKNGVIETENIVSTIPPEELLRICNLPEPYAEKLRKIEYQRTVCALFCLDEKLMDGIYWLNIKSESLPFGVVIEHTNFHDIPEYGGDHLVYVASYVQEHEHGLWEKSDVEIIDIYVDGLKRTFASFDDRKLKWWKLAKATYSAPILKKGYLKSMEGLEEPVDGLYITGMFMMYPERNMNESMRHGKRIASKIIEKDPKGTTTF